MIYNLNNQKYNCNGEKQNKFYIFIDYIIKFFDRCIINKKENKSEYGTFENAKIMNNKKSSLSKGILDLSLSFNEELEVLIPYFS